MWVWLTILSALFLGLYDVAKKKALEKNSVITVLFFTTLLSTLILIPSFCRGPLTDHLWLVFKAVLVTISWISGLHAMDLLPITTASTLKATRPMFVVVFSLIIYGEVLNLWQWAGVILVLGSIFLLNLSSKKEGIDFSKSKGVLLMTVSIFSGVASALLDKHINTWMSSDFVQSWCNLYITVLMGAVLLLERLRQKDDFRRIRWDWLILVIAIFITIADRLYFDALHSEGALLSVVSLIRRCSVVVTFVCGAIVFKERNLSAKALDLLVLLAGMACLVFGSQ